MSVIAFDLGVEDEDDFLFDNKTGDFKIIDSNQQHASAIIESVKGEWKQTPFLGVDLIQFQNGAGASTSTILEQEIRNQFKQDGFKTQDLRVSFDLSTSKLIVETNAIRLR